MGVREFSVDWLFVRRNTCATVQDNRMNWGAATRVVAGVTVELKLASQPDSYYVENLQPQKLNASKQSNVFNFATCHMSTLNIDIYNAWTFFTII